jgi:hypothetical protein
MTRVKVVTILTIVALTWPMLLFRNGRVVFSEPAMDA